jgi:hypothetical protein
VESDWPLTGSVEVAPTAPDRAPRLPVTRVIRIPASAIEKAFSADADGILEHREPTGEVSFTVERSGEHYRFWVQGFGRYLITTDGGVVACEADGAQREQHERFVLAHALPVAAVLRGYEVLHASAISGDGGAAAFAGPSGAGKTRLASRLVARGAGFLTDDVLAVQAAGDRILSQPGPAFMAIRHDDAAMLAELAEAGGRLGSAVGATDKVHVSPPTRGQASALRAIYHIEWGDTFDIAPLGRADLNRTLGLSFVPYLTTPERLVRHLAIAQLVSSTVSQFRLRTPGPELGEDMLVALESHLHGVGV